MFGSQIMTIKIYCRKYITCLISINGAKLMKVKPYTVIIYQTHRSIEHFENKPGYLYKLNIIVVDIYIYYFIFIRETSRLGRHILVSVLFWPCLKCNWLIFKWMNGVSLPKMHQCVYYLTSNSCLLSIFFRKKEFNLPPSYN